MPSISELRQGVAAGKALLSSQLVPRAGCSSTAGKRRECNGMCAATERRSAERDAQLLSSPSLPLFVPRRPGAQRVGAA